MKIKKFAAIDIGSNAMRVLISNVIETKEGVHFQKNALVRAPIRLGEDSFTLGEISKKVKKRSVFWNHFGIQNGDQNHQKSLTKSSAFFTT